MRTIDPNKYINSLNPMRRRLQRTIQELKQDPVRVCSAEAVATHVPIIVVLLFATREDVLGPIQALQDCLTRRLADIGSVEVVEWKN